MDPQPAFTFHDLFSHVIGDMAKSLSERSGEAQDQQFVRSRATVHMIMGFLPRDVPEAMLAGHCVMLHEIMTANVRTTMRADAEPTRQSADTSVVGLNKAFNDTLDRLWRCQKRAAEGSRDTPEVQAGSMPDDAVPEPPPATEPIDPPQPGPVASRPNRAARRQAARVEARASAAASRVASKPIVVSPLPMASPAPAHATVNPVHTAAAAPEAIAARKANAEAMSALKPGDPAGFARAMGVAHPSEAFLAAAGTRGSPFNPHSPGSLPDAATQASATP